ncbi:MAG: AAA family ATPase [Bryobacteraceae bacterium]
MSNWVFSAVMIMGSGGQSLRFTRVLLKNWRSFARGYAELGRRVFVAGPASAGKSNFLDAFRFLGELATAGIGLQEAVRRRGGVRRLRCLAARKDSQVGLLVHAGTSAQPLEWEYEIEIGPDAQGRPMVQREHLRRRETISERPDPIDAADTERLYRSILEGGMAPPAAREFAAFVAKTQLLNPVPALIRRPGGRESSSELCAEILEAMAATPERSRQARLKAILNELRAVTPLLSNLESHRDGRGKAHLRARFEHWRAHGAWLSEAQLSDGILRLIGVLWEILSGTGTLLLEEPEACLHDLHVRQIPQMLSRTARRTGRQILIATHSAALLESPAVAPSEVLLAYADSEGSTLRPATSLAEAAALLRHGLPSPSPSQWDERQMALFAEAED